MLPEKSARFLSAFLAAALFFAFGAPMLSARAAEPVISADACVLMDADSKTVIFEKNADSKMLIASTTKILTALVVIENCRLEDIVEVKHEWANTEGSSMGLKAGDRCTVLELLYGLMLASGNDAGVALANKTAGSVEKFAELMNAKAESLGMTNSHFTNPHGLDDAEHYSTARDMAILAAAAMENDRFALIASTKEVRLSPGRYFMNHNKLLWNCDGCIGLKTGYTSKAGRTLVSACERNGTRLICVTLRDGLDWKDHESLYDWGFENYSAKTVVSPEKNVYELPLVSGEKQSVKVRAAAPIKLFVKNSDEVAVKESLPHFAYSGKKEGETAGRLTVYINGEARAETPLVFAEDAKTDENVPLNFWQRVRWSWYIANEYGGPMIRGYM